MGILEGIFYMLWRGLAIGVIISAPMGPVGILCIQRTLDKGRRAGLLTGVGAAISDFIYCLLTGFGLSFIEEFLERNSSIIQLVGSVVLIGFSVYLFRKNPVGKIKKPVPSQVSAKRSILAGFLFTFSNPLIIFLIIGLFARFNFLLPEIKFYQYVVGYIFIIAGALGWWWLVTFFIDKVRSHFNIRSMWLINKIIGGVILCFAIVGIITAVTDMFDGDTARAKSPRISLSTPALPHSSVKVPAATSLANASRGFDAFGGDSVVTSGSPAVMAVDAGCEPFSARFCLKAVGRGGWRISFMPSVSADVDNGPEVAVSFFDYEKPDPLSETQHLKARATLIRHDRPDSLLAEGEIPYGMKLSHSENLFTFSRYGDAWSLDAGAHGLNPLLSFVAPDIFVDSIRLSAEKSCRLELRDVSATAYLNFAPSKTRTPWTDLRLLAAYIDNSSDPMEDYWTLYDLSLENSLLRMGGDYCLASVRSTDGYDLIYLRGAETGSKLWKPGMVKAHLSDPDADDVWNVSWLDVAGLPLSRGIKAQLDSPSTILIQFPYQSSTIRLRRISRPEWL